MKKISIRRQAGQGMSEYLIMLALIAVTTIAAVRIFGNSVKYQMAQSVQKLLGNEDKPDGIDKPEVTEKAFKGRTMKDFGEAND